jgi:hypothetical protein
MRAQKLREEAAEKDRDEHFNTIQLVIMTEQEWRVKERINTLALMASDDNESLLIKDGSPPSTDMDINMVFALPTEFRGIEEEVAQMCLSPKEVVFEKPEESSQHLKLLCIRGHIDEKLISRMFIDGSTVVNLMSYSIFKKLGREDAELVKTNLALNGGGGRGGNPIQATGVSP